MSAGSDEKRELTPEEARTVARAHKILYCAMALFIVVPIIIAWMLGKFN